MRSVGIIGAGAGGLTAAVTLARQGIPVTVYEAGDRVGGVVQTARENGYLAEAGPNTILETSPKISALIQSLNLDGRRLYSQPGAEKRFLVRNRRTIQLPGGPFSFFLSRLFSIRAKCRLMTEPLRARGPKGVEESVGQFVRRRLGQEFLDYAINPLVGGIYAGAPERLSVRHAFPKLLALEDKYGSLILGQILGARERKKRAEVSKQNAKKLSFDHGLHVLMQALRDALPTPVRFHCRVAKAIHADGTWQLRDAQERTVPGAPHHGLIVATPAFGVPAILPANGAELPTQTLAEIPHPPVATVVLGYRREDVAHPLDGFGVLIPEIERFHILGTLFSSSLFPNRAPAGHVTLTSYIGGTRSPELATGSTQELIKLATEDLAVLLGARGRTTFQHVTVFKRAIPQYEVGYGRYKDIMRQVEAGAPGVFLAGNYREGISLGDSMLSGLDAAEKAMAWLKSNESNLMTTSPR